MKLRFTAEERIDASSFKDEGAATWEAVERFYDLMPDAEIKRLSSEYEDEDSDTLVVSIRGIKE